MTGVLSMFLFKGYLNCYKKSMKIYENLEENG